MVYEATISFRSVLQGVVLADPSAPFPAVSLSAGEPPVPSHEDQQLQREATQSRQAQQEREAIEQVLARLTDVARTFEAQQRHRLGEMQQAAVELAIAVAGRLLHDKIEAGDFPVETLVREVVERLGPRQPVSVFLHPDDIALLQQRLGEKQALFPEATVVRLVPDAALKRGDCRAEAGEVSVLSHLEVQLNDLRQQLLGSLIDAEIERRKALPGDRNLRRFPDRRQTA